MLIVCLLLFFVSPSASVAQSHFDSWTTDDGLPQNNINDIIQTSDGYLWLATFNGLVRYDGVRFTTFNSGTTKGIRSSRLLKLLEDGEGNLWIATEDSGVIRFRDGAFRTYDSQDGLPDNQVSRMALTGRTSDFVLHTSKGAVRWENERFTPCTPADEGPLPGSGFPAGRGAAWYVDENGLHKVDRGSVTAVVPAAGLSASDFKLIYDDRQGSLWMVTKDDELKRFRNGQLTPYLVKDGRPRQAIRSILEDHLGNVWFATRESGLGLFRNEQFKVFTTEDGLSSNNIVALYEDREGNLWIGTRNGLSRLKQRFISTYSEPDGLTASNVYPIYQDRTSAIWIGLWPGLAKYSNGKFASYDEAFGLSKVDVTALYEDREGYLWIGTNGGLIRTRNGRVVYRTREKLFLGSSVRAICQDRANNLWFGTNQRLIRSTDGILTAFTTEDGLAGNAINTLYEDSRGTLWIGTQLGLSAFRDGSFRSYSTKDGLSGYSVRTIHEDADGLLWIGTYDGGLNRFKDGRFTSYTKNEGLFDNGAFQILEDSRGYFWISCNLGIYRLSRIELNDYAEGRANSVTSVAYGKSDGMLNSECNGGVQPAGIKAKDGRFWFPTQEGVAVFDPLSVQMNARPPTVVVEEVTVDNERVQPSDEIIISPDKENFEIAYTGLSFMMPGRIRFRYKLEGLDREWIEAGTRRTAYYSHIPPGAYTFRVIAANRDGIWSPEGASIKVVVIPPFWQTWWFTGLITFALGASALALHHRRIAAFRREHQVREAFSKQLIESQELERKRIAAELHDSLGQNLLVIKNRAMLAKRKIEQGGDTIEQLDHITTATDQAIDEVSEISYNLRPHHLDSLGVGRAIEAMLERISDSSGIDVSVEIDHISDLFTPPDEISIYRMVQESVNNIVKHSEASHARITIKREEKQIEITVADNGRGFDHKAINSNHSRHSGFGLFGISERARMMGGTYSIESTPGSGAIVRLRIGLPDR
jgi:ligand-binding sensor domain-containing protein/signal transduction histidine kinase